MGNLKDKRTPFNNEVCILLASNYSHGSTELQMTWDVQSVCLGGKKYGFGGSAEKLSQFYPSLSQECKPLGKKKETMSLNLLVYRKANWNIFAASTDQKQMESVNVYLSSCQTLEIECDLNSLQPDICK